MQIILIRHAQSMGNATDTIQGQSDNGLSDLGKEQAKKLINYFNQNDFDAIYSSDLGRAIQTAEPTANKLNLPINLDPDFREAHFGIWEGMTYSEVTKKYPKEYTEWTNNYFIRPPWFESFQAHQDRVKRAIEKILGNHKPNDKIAVFTHGGSLKTQIGFFRNMSGEELANFLNKNCSLMLLEFNSSNCYKKGKLIYYNKDVINANVP